MDPDRRRRRIVRHLSPLVLAALFAALSGCGSAGPSASTGATGSAALGCEPSGLGGAKIIIRHASLTCTQAEALFVVRPDLPGIFHPRTAGQGGEEFRCRVFAPSALPRSARCAVGSGVIEFLEDDDGGG